MITLIELGQKFPGWKKIEDWSILTAWRGSIAHGMYVPNSDPNSIDDKDMMVVCAPPKEYYFGLKEFGSRGTMEIKCDVWDIVAYEAKKFIRLLAKGNPNVLSMLWLEECDYIFRTRWGRDLIRNRNLFVGKHVGKSFSGYAWSQLQKMKSGACQGYMGEKRKQLVEKYGYDTKNAAHLIRLLRMGIEFLRDGKLIVKRPDAEELLRIKRGEYSLEAVTKEANELFVLADEAYKNSPLPEKPNYEVINDFCVELIGGSLGYED